MQLYVIAGETSGDQLGGALLEALRMHLPTLKVAGIGGFQLMRQGMPSLFPMHELSLMGFVEILPHIFRLKRRIRETVADIEARKPDVLLTIDSPGFTMRVIKQLRARQVHLPRFVHYVAPSVWAYKPERAKEIAPLLDALLVLLPFEPAYFERVGLTTHFVGHPAAWWWKNKGFRHKFREQHGISDAVPVVALFPGSRHNELMRHLPLFRASMLRLKQQHPLVHNVMLIGEALADDAAPALADWPCPLTLVFQPDAKRDLFAAADAAITKSGTISLEAFLAGVPSVTVYKANPLTAMYVKRLLKTPFVHLANILARRMLVPELLQKAATPEAVAHHIDTLLSSKEAREAQLLGLEAIRADLGAYETQSPSERAAQCLLAHFPHAERSVVSAAS